jgi:hypothetical protein
MRSSTDSRRIASAALGLVLLASAPRAQDRDASWGTAERERQYYRVVKLPTPPGAVIEAGAFEVLPDGRIAVGTRHGDIYFVRGADAAKPDPVYELFATGLDEIFGLAWRDGALYVTQSCELTRVQDSDGDGRADRFDAVSAAWGYENYHEYAFGSKFDEQGNLHVALGLSASYHSRALFRGWVMRVTPEGESLPIASGLRSPAGIGPNEHGALFVIESQGPWNSSCSLKAVRPGSFLGHPASFNWYDFAPNLGGAPQVPRAGGRLIDEADRIEALEPYAVVFPYIRMGRSISGFRVDRTGGRFGPFEDQMFLGDFTLSLVMRATTEEVNGVWQGACYPFREGLSTGLLDVQFTPEGHLLCGGTNRGWPVRGIEPFALERIQWTGVVPFEIRRITITPDGFRVEFTKPLDRDIGTDPDAYALSTFTHIYHGAYGGPEVDRTTPQVQTVVLSEDGATATLVLDPLVRGHVHEFDLGALRSRDGEELVHRNAYYTVNEIPGRSPGKGAGAREVVRTHPVPPDPRWLTYEGGEGPGAGRHVVLVAAEQEYRAEQSMPMLARMLAERHGFDTTVLFALNEDGLVDPSLKDGQADRGVVHTLPGLEHLRSADLLILFTRFIRLSDEDQRRLTTYLDSGRPILGIRTANHGFVDLDYTKGGKRVRIGEDVLGGTFRAHHGRWHQDSTRGIPVPEHAAHPVMAGVTDLWGPSDVYRTYPEGGALPAGCTPLVMGQPLTGRSPDDPPNPDLVALPVAWVKTWTGDSGNTARVFHTTMGSARDFQSAGLRRLVVNAVYWCLGMEDEIDPASRVDPVGEYAPLESGFDHARLGVLPRPPGELR